VIPIPQLKNELSYEVAATDKRKQKDKEDSAEAKSASLAFLRRESLELLQNIKSEVNFTTLARYANLVSHCTAQPTACLGRTSQFSTRYLSETGVYST